MLTPDLLFRVFHFDRFDHLVYTVLDLVDDVGRNTESGRNLVYWTIFKHISAVNLARLLLHRHFCEDMFDRSLVLCLSPAQVDMVLLFRRNG